MKTIKVRDKQFRTMIDKLSEQIKASGKTYKAIYGASPDGQVIAVWLSERLGIHLGIKQFYHNGDMYFKFEHTEFENCAVLVVSDIINTGATREQYKDFDFACLFAKTENKFNKLEINAFHEVNFLRNKIYFVELIDKSIKVVMPWEVK